MDNRLRSTSKSHTRNALSLSTGDIRTRYHAVGHNDTISLVLPYNDRTMATAGSIFVSDRRIQQRYKLLLDGLVQVCRVPHAKNIIEKIRFSRFLRRWEPHHIHLEQSEIRSETVGVERFVSLLVIAWGGCASRTKATWIGPCATRPLRTSRSGPRTK